jgi:hypothetical protein
MHAFLRERITRKLESLSDERVYQVLDYIEFLESKYAERQAPPANVFQRFAEGAEDMMRAGKISASTVAETMSLLSKAMGVLSGVAAAGKSVASDLAGGVAAAGRSIASDLSGGTRQDAGAVRVTEAVQERETGTATGTGAEDGEGKEPQERRRTGA